MLDLIEKKPIRTFMMITQELVRKAVSLEIIYDPSHFSLTKLKEEMISRFKDLTELLGEDVIPSYRTIHELFEKWEREGIFTRKMGYEIVIGGDRYFYSLTSEGKKFVKSLISLLS
ncbi:MAG: hypothetical protein ACTSQP_22640 [Promethearchaeota archaeon]